MAGTLGTLLILPRLQALYQGVYAAGALLYTYEAGTSTPLATYTTQDLSVANAQGMAADQYGLFSAVYMLDRAYKVRVTTAAGVTIYEQDNVRPYTVPALNRVDPSICNGRLTLTSGTPVTTADVTAATTVYFAPYGGNKIALYNATYGWDLFEFSQLSIALGTDTASLPYDVFAYINAGAVAIERLPWTNGTTRATNLTTQDGVLVKSGDATRRYLGTYRTTSTIGQTEDSAANRLVWNYTNRVRRALGVREATSVWTYTTAVFRQARGSAANQVGVVVGVAESVVDLTAIGISSNGSIGTTMATAIGEDSTDTPKAGSIYAPALAPVADYSVLTQARLSTAPAVGYHFYAWLEYSAAAGTTTWRGAPAAAYQSGMVGFIDG